MMNLTITLERDGRRWLATIQELPGAMAYGASRAEAIRRVKVVALEGLAMLAEMGERKIEDDIRFQAA